MMHSPEYQALAQLREELAVEHRGIWEEMKRRTDAADEAEGEMWRTLGYPGGTEVRDAWLAALEYRNELHFVLKDFYRRSNERSAKMKALHEAEMAAMNAEDAARGLLPA